MSTGWNGKERSASEICGSSCGDLADTECDRSYKRAGEQGNVSAQGQEGQIRELYESSHLADTETAGRGTDWIESGNSHEKNWRREGSDCELSDNFWHNSVWLPCADGKVRRAPDDSFGVVDGLHRSVLAGLGNSIVPQVAYEIIKAIKQITTSPR